MKKYDEKLLKMLTEQYTDLNPNRPVYWWEKSVEYLFVAKAVEKNWFTLIAPLAGNAEKYYGDLILQQGVKFYLIEFKRDDTSWIDETKKYSDEESLTNRLIPYLLALGQLKENAVSQSHLLVFGKIDANIQKPSEIHHIKLQRAYYTKPNEYTEFQGFDSIKGSSKDDFDNYLELMKYLRSETEEGKVSSGSGALCYVAAVSSEKPIQTVALTLNEYETLRLKLNLQLTTQRNSYTR